MRKEKKKIQNTWRGDNTKVKTTRKYKESSRSDEDKLANKQAADTGRLIKGQVETIRAQQGGINVENESTF